MFTIISRYKVMDSASNILSDITNFAKNLAKLLIDIPYYLYLLISSLITSLIRNTFQWQKKFDSSDVVLVTGAASGIGKNVVLKLAKLFPETTYVLWDINKTGLEETAEKCQKLGALKVYIFLVDLSNKQDILKTAALVREQIGSVTVLWNNAGICPYHRFLNSDSETDDKVIRINLLSYMWIIKEFLPDMVKEGKGHVISSCSVISFFRCSQLTTYAASKYGLRGFLESLKLEMRKHPDKPNIQFSTIYPYFVKTQIFGGVSWEPRYSWKICMPMEVDYVGDEILMGILKGKEEIFIPGSFRFIDVLFRYLPSQFIDRVEEYVYRNFTGSESHYLDKIVSEEKSCLGLNNKL